MLDALFGNPLVEKILFYLLKNQKCYASELKKVFDKPLYSIQRILTKLEKGGIIVSFKEGKTRVFQLNPRYPMLSELLHFLEKAYSFLPDKQRLQYYEKPIRKRPRRSGKPL